MSKRKEIESKMALLDGKLASLLGVCVRWRDKYKPRAPESIQQVDEISLACHELAEDVCNVIGYWNDEDPVA